MIQLFSCKPYKKREVGMTLIELLFSVAIISILAAIAYPSFTEHSLKAHRTAAKVDMARIQLQLEESYDSGYDWSSIISSGNCTICDSDSTRYLFSVTSSASMAYTITATAQTDVGQTNDKCLPQNKTMTLDALGQTTPSDCW
ncbi:type IV pilin protein [uncultured Vibrio sp.]|uniref:type IV pilin protein n=1 Tax=uncultured Vibrio sp. TaxID=114054 RepID=UPI00091B8E93|nr:type IV pilin protein [uncultured Vibrio sp.]OIQ26041.1 MAG: prepilin-type N-terminal cleavage/methylation domain-containing protein [Vibrio sp. MedPE-SWchi]